MRLFARSRSVRADPAQRMGFDASIDNTSTYIFVQEKLDCQLTGLTKWMTNSSHRTLHRKCGWLRSAPAGRRTVGAGLPLPKDVSAETSLPAVAGGGM
jgi:hypothetical protein